MKLELPTKIKGEGVNLLTKVLGDPISKAITGHILANGPAYLNELSRELAEKKIASRRPIYERLVELETIGILESAMVRIEYTNSKETENPIKAWVKRYSISDQHRNWLNKLLG